MACGARATLGSAVASDSMLSSNSRLSLAMNDSAGSARYAGESEFATRTSNAAPLTTNLASVSYTVERGTPEFLATS